MRRWPERPERTRKPSATHPMPEHRREGAGVTALSPLVVPGSDRTAGTLVPAILCGGSGSRLWPVSRRDFAKQHVPMLGGASPFQRTLGRLAATLFAEPIVISAAASRFLVADQAAGSRHRARARA